MAPRLIPLLLLCATAPGQQGSTNEPFFRKDCGSCHSVSLIDDLKSVPEWEETVEEMIDRGAKASPAERAAILRYLIRNYTRININTASAEEISAVLDIDQAAAQKLIPHRPYKSFDELMKIGGHPRRLLEMLKDRIAFR